MRAKIFLRRNTREYSKLGNKRKKLLKWRRPKGRDNKMRLKEKGRPRTVEIGYKQALETRGKIDGKDIFMVQNIEDLKQVKKGSVINLGRMGSKKKLEMMKVVKEKELKVLNFSFGLFEKNHKEKPLKKASKEDKKEVKKAKKNKILIKKPKLKKNIVKKTKEKKKSK